MIKKFKKTVLKRSWLFHCYLRFLYRSAVGSTWKLYSCNFDLVSWTHIQHMTFPGLLWGCESSAWIYWWIWRLFSHLWRIGFQLWGGSIKPLERWCCMCFKHWKWSVIPPFTFRILETRLAQRHCCCILRSRVSSWTDVYSQRHWHWNRQRRRSALEGQSQGLAPSHPWAHLWKWFRKLKTTGLFLVHSFISVHLLKGVPVDKNISNSLVPNFPIIWHSLEA